MYDRPFFTFFFTIFVCVCVCVPPTQWLPTHCRGFDRRAHVARIILRAAPYLASSVSSEAARIFCLAT